jgi:hypothetical protein
MPLVVVELTDDAGDGKSRGVRVETDWEIGIEVTKDWSRGKSALEFLKGFLSLRGPMKMLILAKEGGNRSSNARVGVDEATIEISEAQKDLDILDRGRNRPFGNSCDPIGFHGNTVGRDDKPKKGD